MTCETEGGDLTLREVAARTRFVEPTIRKWITSGKLAAYQIGLKRQYRVRVVDLDAFLNRR